MNKPIVVSVFILMLSACTPHLQTGDTSQSYPLPENPVLESHPINQEKIVLNQQLSPPKPQERVITPDIYQTTYTENPEVVRYDRYLLLGAAPQGGQKYLLDQLVEVNVTQRNKKQFTATVEQGFRTALKDSGLQLCSGHSDVSVLFSRPLPKVHYRFGPMQLRDALQMLAGPAYELTLNDITRTVCFNQRDVPQVRSPKVISTSVETITRVIAEDEIDN
ncbi:PFGI-1 class ICE element type IV pilus protein PilL2 [Pasteurella testudinis]|uniref:PFGI-1 class ICE element type IV pilus protein PilL2 n=1 Tax=Pasteurella testudinis TaxID=761 RepID=UPI004059944B